MLPATQTFASSFAGAVRPTWLALVTFALVSTHANADDSNWTRLEHDILTTVRAQRAASDRLEQLKAAHDQASQRFLDTPHGGFWGIGDPKRRAKEEVEALDEQIAAVQRESTEREARLKALLTGPPPSVPAVNTEPFEASQEVSNLRNALENVNADAQALGAMLETDKSDSAAAVEYYQAYSTLLGYLEAMHASFIERVAEQGKYYQSFKKLWGSWIRHRQSLQTRLAQTTSAETRDLLSRQIGESTAVLAEMPNYAREFARVKHWAERNLRLVRDRKTAIALLANHADLTNQTIGIRTALASDFSALSFEQPPLVQFSVDMEKLRVPATGPDEGAR